MNESDNFALVPKPSGAVEKVEPGARRILAGMIADTLALAKIEQVTKSVFNVLLGFNCDPNTPYKWFKEGIEAITGERYDVKFTCFESEEELLRLAWNNRLILSLRFSTISTWKTRRRLV